ncbi:MAG: helix-turn-helix domain-containing protein [Acetobacteraceae bacterium]|nr:helix-turn-helix domain-containing protein [Acetobacteraceae bacterium]MBV8522873.1 helix-turn-helix domain-containing protein [Acetobacteraceae bacterium]MBV8591355.1 helix-turn-helix domain-containing protein [Acetobacteraceae bacterium]
MNQQQQIAARLRRVLDENEWSAAELARRLKVSQPTVHAWLHGTHSLRAHNARRAARALGISPAWLIFGADRNAEATAQTADELALLRLYRELDEREQAAMLRRLQQACKLMETSDL